jgi:ribosomal protein L37AE/L43A
MIVKLSHCDHPMIRQEADGHWYCTECRARVA